MGWQLPEGWTDNRRWRYDKPRLLPTGRMWITEDGWIVGEEHDGTPYFFNLLSEI